MHNGSSKFNNTFYIKTFFLLGGGGEQQKHRFSVIDASDDVDGEGRQSGQRQRVRTSLLGYYHAQQQNPVWWWGASINLISIGLWTALMFFMRSITKSEPKVNTQGDLYGSLQAVLSTIILWQTGTIMMLYVYMVVCGSQNIATHLQKAGGVSQPTSRNDNSGNSSGGSGGGGVVTAGILAEPLDGPPGGLWLDFTAIRVGIEWIILGALAFFCFEFVVGGDTGYFLGLLTAYAIGFLWLLPRAARHHGDNDPGAKRLPVLVTRSLLAGVPLAVFSENVLPRFARSMSADALIFWWPLLLSFIEFLVVSKLLSDHAVMGHGVEALSIEARQIVALIEGTRLGLVVLVANTVGTKQGWWRQWR